MTDDDQDDAPSRPRRPGSQPAGPAPDYAPPGPEDWEPDEVAAAQDEGDRGEPQREAPLPTRRRSPELLPHGDRLAGTGAAESVEAAFLAAEEPPPRRLFAFYDRLRQRIAEAVERRAGRLGRPAADALLLVPDVFMLLARLALDPQVPKGTRSLIGGALAYFVLPFDLLPEGLLGGAGFLDDLVLAVAVLSQALSPDLEALARRYWSGRQELRQVMQDVVGAAHSLLGENLFGKLQALLARRGVVLGASGGRDSRAGVA